ncbi:MULTISPECIES: ABC transporter ATP-binding protein [Streptomyces]|uniref:ABC transporter ATP-binding protein n=1 Tax=Streptomyces TaxID=1883 RepID=UPI0005877D9E|nr:MULTISPECIES: ABC transporter ATP-binding protein [Streptomyces]
MAHTTTVEHVTVIATESLSKRFPRVTALDRLSVDITPGVTGLVGANGAGKSTLIKILLGLSPASEGRAAVLGLDVATEGSAIRESVGYMPEHDCLPPDVSATEFVVHMARMSGLPPSAARERTADTLRHVGLYEERYRPIGGYSTGMKQRVKLAQALVHDPKLVLLDEPTNGLDPVGRDDMLGLIRRIHTDFGISVLVTSHLLGELERTCDHVVVIDGGKLLRSSSTSDFTQATASLAVEVTDTDEHPDGTAALRAALDRAGLTASPARRGADGAPASDHLLLVDVEGEETYDAVRDAIAGLGLGLVRMEQRRHRIAEIFSSDSDGSDSEGNGNGGAVDAV